MHLHCSDMANFVIWWGSSVWVAGWKSSSCWSIYKSIQHQRRSPICQDPSTSRWDLYTKSHRPGEPWVEISKAFLMILTERPTFCQSAKTSWRWFILPETMDDSVHLCVFQRPFVCWKSESSHHTLPSPRINLDFLGPQVQKESVT